MVGHISRYRFSQVQIACESCHEFCAFTSFWKLGVVTDPSHNFHDWHENLMTSKHYGSQFFAVRRHRGNSRLPPDIKGKVESTAEVDKNVFSWPFQGDFVRFLKILTNLIAPRWNFIKSNLDARRMSLWWFLTKVFAKPTQKKTVKSAIGKIKSTAQNSEPF